MVDFGNIAAVAHRSIGVGKNLVVTPPGGGVGLTFTDCHGVDAQTRRFSPEGVAETDLMVEVNVPRTAANPTRPTVGQIAVFDGGTPFDIVKVKQTPGLWSVMRQEGA